MKKLSKTKESLRLGLLLLRSFPIMYRSMVVAPMVKKDGGSLYGIKPLGS